MRGLSPAAALFLGYIAVSFVGGLILYLPPMHTGGVSLLDALFTATSAVCVTGLIVVDTAKAWTLWGKVVLALLIQIGGLGYMTLGALLFAAIGSKGSLRARRMLAMSLGAPTLSGILEMAKKVVIAAVIVEGVAVLPLWLAFSGRHGVWGGLGHALFHSVSALNNAGFSTFSNSLMDYATSPTVNLVVMALIVIGGIGFKVWRDAYHHFRGNLRRFDLHDRLVFLSTALLIGGSFLLFLLFEPSMGPGVGRGWQALFAAITPRTAGFNTVDYAQLSPFSKLLTVGLMFVGGSPGGTAGGIKTITVTVIFLWLLNTLQGRENVFVLRRTLPQEVVVKAFQTFILAIAALWLWTLVLSVSERSVIEGAGFLNFLFEVVSAFGTVGLSTGSLTKANVSLVADFTVFGKILVMLAMIIGRAGYLVFAASLIRTVPSPFKYAEEEVLV